MSVAVIIPTYNRANFVAAAVESALNQTRRPDQIIVIDDGSTDDTPHVLSRFGSSITLIRQHNGGEAAARNTGLDAATTDAVVFLDSDDLLVPYALERFASTLEQNPDVGVAYSDVFLCDADMHRTGLYSEQLPGHRPSGWVLGELARRSFLVVTSMVRRDAIGGIRFERGMTCAADYDFWRQIAVRCQFKFIDEPLLCYRFHDAMVTTSHVTSMLAAEVEVQRRIIAMPEFADLPAKTRARALCAHGIKHAVLGAVGDARRNFWRSVLCAPAYPGSYLLLALSLLGPRPLQYAILKRRQLAGNRMGAKAGAAAMAERRAVPTRPANVAATTT